MAECCWTEFTETSVGLLLSSGQKADTRAEEGKKLASIRRRRLSLLQSGAAQCARVHFARCVTRATRAAQLALRCVSACLRRLLCGGYSAVEAPVSSAKCGLNGRWRDSLPAAALSRARSAWPRGFRADWAPLRRSAARGRRARKRHSSRNPAPL